jgi:tetratricopeptide (TPR) repeat protein
MLRWLPCLLVVGLLAGCEDVAARRRIQQGTRAYGDGRYEDAIVDFQTALQRRPSLSTGWYNLGVAHLALFSPGAKDQASDTHALAAIEAFKRYLDMDPTNKKARDYLLSTYIDSGHFEGALDYFEGRVARNAKDYEALAQLADINTKAGRFDAAIRWHRQRAAAEESTDAKADAHYAVGVLDWRRLYKKADVVRAHRAELADQGIAELLIADQLRPNHADTLAFINLLYRERALAHETSYARAVDIATAQVYLRRNLELLRAAAATAPKTTPEKPNQGGKP